MLSFTATELLRFMGCPGSRLMGGSPPYESNDEDAHEGDAAHWLSEQAFRGVNPQSFIDQKAPNGTFITTPMIEYCEKYVHDIRATGGEVEVDTSYRCPYGTWEIRGRCDHVALMGTTLLIDDFKFGWKIVEVEDNWTLVWHATGWRLRNPHVPVTEVIFKIYQPRPFHPFGPVRHCILTVAELDALAQILFAKLANPGDVVCSGEHCYKCPSITQCPAAQMATMNSIDVAEKAFDSHVNNAQLSFMLDQIDRASAMLKQSRDGYEDLAKIRIRAGETIPEYLTDTALGQKKFKKGITPEIMQCIVGFDVSKRELPTPNQVVKLGVDEKIVELLTERGNNGIKLVRMNIAKKAEKLLGKKA